MIGEGSTQDRPRVVCMIPLPPLLQIQSSALPEFCYYCDTVAILFKPFLKAVLKAQSRTILYQHKTIQEIQIVHQKGNFFKILLKCESTTYSSYFFGILKLVISRYLNIDIAPALLFNFLTSVLNTDATLTTALHIFSTVVPCTRYICS